MKTLGMVLRVIRVGLAHAVEKLKSLCDLRTQAACRRAIILYVHTRG
jgi:hypothetical protein